MEENDASPDHFCWSPDGKSLALSLEDWQRDAKGKKSRMARRAAQRPNRHHGRRWEEQPPADAPPRPGGSSNPTGADPAVRTQLRADSLRDWSKDAGGRSSPSSQAPAPCRRRTSSGSGIRLSRSSIWRSRSSSSSSPASARGRRGRRRRRQGRRQRGGLLRGCARRGAPRTSPSRHSSIGNRRRFRPPSPGPVMPGPPGIRPGKPRTAGGGLPPFGSGVINPARGGSTPISTAGKRLTFLVACGDACCDHR